MKPGLTKREREITDSVRIRQILDTAKILHLGLVDGEEPYVLPMNYGYTLEEGQLVLYLHSAVSGRKLDLIRANPRVYFSLECDIAHFAGQLPCQYGTAYQSLSGRGIAQILEDPQEKMDAMTVFMKSQTGKDFSFNKRLVSIVSVIRIRVTNYTAKHRDIPERLAMEMQK